MAERYNQTAENGVGAVFSPAVDPAFQITREEGSQAVVSFYGRQASSLPWALIESVDASMSPWVRLAQVKQMQISVTGNTNGKRVQVTDGE